MPDPVEAPSFTESELLDARILLVDDEEANVRILERILEDAGYTNLLRTTDPREALVLYEQHRPDLVVLDLRMPVLDGFEVMERLSVLGADEVYLPILVLTADATPAAKRRALSTGARDFLTKPLDLAEVRLRIRNLLETRFLYRKLQQHNRLLESRVRERTAALYESLTRLELADRKRQMLMGHLVKAQEEERARVAGDIHDDTIQVMTAVGMRLWGLRRALEDPQALSLVEQLEATVDEAIARLRSLLFDLRPPVLDAEGLAPAVRASLERLRDEAELDGRVVNGMSREPGPDTRVIVYRIIQEALANVRKHARARRVAVHLESSEGGCRVRVSDDGRGFSAEQLARAIPGHIGLTAMRERAEMAGGWWRVASRPGSGTDVEFWVPESQEEQEEEEESAVAS
jgi:signal transduction histidine kinase